MTAREEKDRSGREITPPRMADITPPVYPSGDYSYILEIVMGMQNTLGKFSEAIESLKSQSKQQGDKLDQIGKDVHAAKVVMSVVGGLFLLAAAFLGWTINTALQYFLSHPAK